VELTETLPSVPQGRQVVRKQKAQEVESSRYEYAALFFIHQYCCTLTLSACSPPASPLEPERQEMGTDPAASAIGSVTIAVVGTAPPAGVTPPPATSTMVGTPQAMRVKKAVMKRSSL
jgi:hypothetical protein